jgi:hypothetical protein
MYCWTESSELVARVLALQSSTGLHDRWLQDLLRSSWITPSGCGLEGIRIVEPTQDALQPKRIAFRN